MSRKSERKKVRKELVAIPISLNFLLEQYSPLFLHYNSHLLLFYKLNTGNEIEYK